MLCTHNVLDELGPVPPDGLDGLEDVDLAVLHHLLDARVRRAVHARARVTVPANVNKRESRGSHVARRHREQNLLRGRSFAAVVV